MPSKSEKQKRFFTIAAHNSDFAKKAGIDPEVAKEWHEADKEEETHLKAVQRIRAAESLFGFLKSWFTRK